MIMHKKEKEKKNPFKSAMDNWMESGKRLGKD